MAMNTNGQDTQGRSDKNSHRHRVVIIGAGFGGLWAARELAGKPFDVTLIDRNNYHTFLPLLYQVAAAELAPEDIAYPIRKIIRHNANIKFVLGEVPDIDFGKQIVFVDGHDIPYDYLVLAVGSSANYFGIPGAREHSFPLKTLEDAIRLRNHILDCFEEATHLEDKDRQREYLTFAIVGGGPTGVEYAGALAELVAGPLRKDFHDLDLGRVRIIILEAADRLLASFAPRLSDYTYKRLSKMGVEIKLNSAVAGINPDTVFLRNNESISARTVIWTAGIQGNPDAKSWKLPLTAAGLVDVSPDLSLKNHGNVFVIGDLARLAPSDSPPVPMLAPAAIQQGKVVARNIICHQNGWPLIQFNYRDKGTMVTIGRNAAVAQIRGLGLTGYPAWLLWLFVHLINLIGFRNKLLVMLNWAWDYLFFERAIRLIFPRR